MCGVWWLAQLVKERVAASHKRGTKYIGALYGSRLVGVVAWQMVGNNVRFKMDYVVDEFRGKGVYAKLWDAREQKIKDRYHKRVTAFCTVRSLGKYVKAGFTPKAEKHGITFVTRGNK